MYLLLRYQEKHVTFIFPNRCIDLNINHFAFVSCDLLLFIMIDIHVDHIIVTPSTIALQATKTY